MFVFNALIVVVLTLGVQAENCPGGGEIYARGISNAGKAEVISVHNKLRLDIANGRVAGQPRGINLKRMIYDNILGVKARDVSNTCEMEHVHASDGRWSSVGQNIFMEWNSGNNSAQNWTRVVDSWFNEEKSFVYPNTSHGTTGHYTQVVWASSVSVGCDFIYFYDPSNPSTPYCKIYTCNYGPGGNLMNAAPYQKGTTGCNNLC